MPCDRLPMPNGGAAIVCSGVRNRCCVCGRRATQECDWKVLSRRSGTCDAPICTSCSTVPVPGKDLCAKHADAWAAWKARA